MKHPLGTNKGKHKLYEGSEKAKYACKYCGKTYNDLPNLTNNSCLRYQNGSNKGRHSPALLSQQEALYLLLFTRLIMRKILL